MKYTDRFLAALGAWQNGWREEKERRLPITSELLAAINDMMPDRLPVSTPLPTCYRKRFLVPKNPQNGGDFWRLIIDGSIIEGVASWTLSAGFAKEFKEIHREGCLTAIFEHRPKPGEVVVDIPALWKDQTFIDAVEEYSNRNAPFWDALKAMRDEQYEIILNSPLLRSEAVDFIGVVNDENYFFRELGAETEEAQDVIWKCFAKTDTFPGDRKWTGRSGAQRAVTKISAKFQERYLFWAYLRLYKEFLLETTYMTPPNQYIAFLKKTSLINLFTQ